jgi:hypothetical protein
MTSANNYDVYASGPIHGNGSGLTNMPPSGLSGMKFTGTFPGVGTTLYITNGIVVTNSTP